MVSLWNPLLFKVINLQGGQEKSYKISDYHRVGLIRLLVVKDASLLVTALCEIIRQCLANIAYSDDMYIVTFFR